MLKGGRGEREGGKRGVFFLISFFCSACWVKGGGVKREIMIPHIFDIFFFLFFSLFFF